MKLSLRYYWQEILLSLVSIFVCSIIIKRVLLSWKLRKLPGPFALPIIGNSIQLRKGTEGYFKLAKEYTAKFGNTFILWVGSLPLVAVTDPDDLQRILSSKTLIEKSGAYRFFKPWLGKGILLLTGQEWHNRRKLLTNSFHNEILTNFIEPVFKEGQIMEKMLEKEVNGSAFNIVPYSKLCSLDVICDTAMGKEVNAQENSQGEIPVAIDRVSESVFVRYVTPWLRIEPFFKLSKYSTMQNESLKVIHGFTDKIVQERIQERKSLFSKGNVNSMSEVPKGKRRLAFLDLLLELRENGNALSDIEIRDEVNTITFGGFDTTGSAIGWILFVLGHHPEIQEKIVEEVEEVWEDPNRCPTLSELNKLNYLDRCIKEGMRLFPPVPIISRQITEPFTLENKVTLPAGVAVTMNIFILHRNEKYFPNANKFDPDRFLPENSTDRHPYAYIPFSAGYRNCLGSKFAMMELKTILSILLRNYEFKSVQKEEELVLRAELVLVNKNGIPLKISRRKR